MLTLPTWSSAAGVPGAPQNVVASPGVSGARVTWDAPASDGGSAVTSYRVQTYQNGNRVDLECTLSAPFTLPLTCQVNQLTNGAAYTFEVVAYNRYGAGPASARTTAVTPQASAPGAPSGISGTPGNAQVTVSFGATLTNGSPITSFTVQTYLNGVAVVGRTCTLTGSFTSAVGHSCVVTGLTNGTAYTFKATATNAVGTGPASVSSDPATPAWVPLAPRNPVATAGQGQAGVTWTAPVSDEGSPITSYTVQAYQNGVPVAGKTCAVTLPAALTCVVTGLDDATAYTFKVAATNALGTGAESAASPTVTTPAVVPGAPTGVVATAGTSQAGVSWTAPAADGGAAISSYTVQAYVGGVAVVGRRCTASAPFTPPLACVVTGLTNGTAYTFTVAATNSAGTGPNSAASTAVTPQTTVPGAPLNPTATPGNAQASVVWDAPASDGGSPIISYTVQAFDGGVAVRGGTCTVRSPFTSPLTCLVTGLSNGVAFTFTVAATNSVGTGVPSEQSAAVIPATPPAAPTGAEAIAGDSQANVYWPRPEDDGGRPITSFTAQAYRAGVAVPGATCTLSSPFPSPLTCLVTGLTNGIAYTFRVAATNAVGTGPASNPSNAVTPTGVPGPPVNPAASAGEGRATVTWAAPANNGGAAVTSYAVQAYHNGVVVVDRGCTLVAPFTPPLTCQVNQLTDGTAYTFGVKATNSVGAGPESVRTAAVTPRATVPSAPEYVYGTPGNAQVTVYFGAVTSNGSPLSAFSVQTYLRGVAVVGRTCTLVGRFPSAGGHSCVVTGLTNGTAYTFRARATNGVGTGPASVPSDPATPAWVPLAPRNPVATAGQGQAGVTWTAPVSDEGSPITSYTVQAYQNGVAVVGATCAVTLPAALTCLVTGLTNATAYTFKVAATNALGTGAQSVGSPAVIPRATVPGAPSSVVAAAGQGQATVRWFPAQSGGAGITSYRVQAYVRGVAVPGKTCTQTAPFMFLPVDFGCVVTGLTNGTAYTFTVAAINSVGTGPNSLPSAPVTPQAVLPGAPLNVLASAGPGRARVTWSAPTSDGGAPISSYRVQALAGGVAVPGAVCIIAAPFASPLTCDVTGLTNGTAYTFTVAATNSAGIGPDSAASAAVTPLITVPGAPLNPTATSQNAAASVTWDAPTSDGGQPVTSYTVQAYDAGVAVVGKTCSVTLPAPLTCEVTGLDNGTAYTFAVAATNAIGTGAASNASAAVTPATVPGAPTGVSASARPGRARVFWSPPEVDGGSPITSYTVQAYDGGVEVAGKTCTVAAPFPSSYRCDVTGLTDGATYTFRVAATNSAGTGERSDASNAVTLPTVPGAPQNVGAVAGQGQASVSWSEGSSGGSGVTSYTVQAYADGVAVPGRTCTATTPLPFGSDTIRCVVDDLTNGTAYTFSVAATNAVGTGPESTRSEPVTPEAVLPGAPRNVLASAGQGRAGVTWAAPESDGGAPIGWYRVQAFVDGVAVPGVVCTLVAPFAAPLTCEVTGLTNGVAYTFAVAATTSVGIGPESAASAAVTPEATAPGAPTDVSVRVANRRAAVTWSPPASDGGSPITSYRVQAFVGQQAVPGKTCTVSAPFTAPLTCMVDGLAAGTDYTFSVAAINVLGEGRSSAPSAGTTAPTTSATPTTPTTAVSSSPSTSQVVSTSTLSTSTVSTSTGTPIITTETSVTPGDTLSYTGVDVWSGLIPAGLLLGGGALLLLATKRRRGVHR